jgi:hypothetical protein
MREEREIRKDGMCNRLKEWRFVKFRSGADHIASIRFANFCHNHIQ